MSNGDSTAAPMTAEEKKLLNDMAREFREELVFLARKLPAAMTEAERSLFMARVCALSFAADAHRDGLDGYAIADRLDRTAAHIRRELNKPVT